MKILAGLIMLATATGASAADLYVSTTGSDANPGTLDRPLQSLPAAQNAARVAKAGSPLTVHVAPGTYYLARPLVFTPADSGAKDAPVTWRADAAGPVVISGGQRLNLSFTPYKNGIQQARAPDDVSTDQLFVNGERQILARYPNYDPRVLIFNGYAADAMSAERAARWADPAGAFFHAMHPALWGGFSYRLTGKDARGVPTYEGGWQGNRKAGPHKTFRYVENIFEELDAPGEWYLNPHTHVLYFYPPAGLDLSNAVVEVPRLKHLVEFQGTEKTPVEWVTLRGFTFRHTLRTFMETREPILRSDWTIYRGGAVLFNGAQDCAIENAWIDQVGGNAVFVNNYNRRVKVTGSRIDRPGAGGVMFVGSPGAVRGPLFEYGQTQPVEKMDPAPGPRSDDYPADCRVEDCLITQVGRVEKQATGVGIDMAARITVSHCSIYDVPRAGINIGDGCWGGHVVEGCDVFDTVQETGDHGSFNSWGRDRYWLPNIRDVDKRVAAHPALPLLDVVEPITLRDNRWRCDHGWDIDLDDGSSNYHIYDNLCLHGGIKNREGYRRVVENNVMVNNSFHPHVWYADSGGVFEHNIVFGKYQPIGMPAPWPGQIDFNFAQDAGVQTPVTAVELKKASGGDEHSMRGDAQFIDPARGNYNVRDTSPALALGFKNFPMDRFGVTSPALKAIARVPSFEAKAEPPSRRDRAVFSWQGAQVRNIVGLGEQSAHGLAGETGVLVLAVGEGSPLAGPGLQAGDVILSINDTAIDSAADLRHAEAKRPFKLTVSRDQAMRTLDVK